MSRQSRHDRAWAPLTLASVWVDETKAPVPPVDARRGYVLVGNSDAVRTHNLHLTGVRLSALRERALRRQRYGAAAKALRHFRVDAQLLVHGVRFVPSSL